MTQIQIVNIRRNASYSEITYQMGFLLPVIYGTGSSPIKGLGIIISSYPDGFSLGTDAVAGTIINYTETVSLNTANPTLAAIKTQLQNRYIAIRARLDALSLSNFDTLAGLSYDGTIWS
jgi:hypothetical protein